jgi:hypothetical protein
VPGYLGRVLDGGAPVGTCFQVAPGVLVTAWHVLDDIGAAAENARVRIDPLAGGEAFDAAAARMDPLRDLAVLTTAAGLPTVAGRLVATDQMTLRVTVTVTGHVAPDDPGHMYRFLNAPGEWAGGTTRDDAVPLGRMTSSAVVPGMSGAPVIRDSDGAVAGVVSGRYNSTDGWLADTVWVARTEDLVVLLNGIADVTMWQAPLAGPVDLLLTVTANRIQLTGPGIDVAADHSGVRPGLGEAVHETRRSRDLVSLPVRSETQTKVAAGELALGRAARLLGESFLPGPVLSQLAKVLAAAERAHQPVRFGLAVPPELAGLPWEALPSPDGRGPLALHPLVSVYRKTDAAATRRLPGPLRIVVAIAAPDSGGGRCWIMSGNCAMCWPRSAPPVRTPPTSGWCRSLPRGQSGPSLTAARPTCCISPDTASPAPLTWRVTTGRPGRSPPMSSPTRRSRRGGCRRWSPCRPATPTRPGVRAGPRSRPGCASAAPPQ